MTALTTNNTLLNKEIQKGIYDRLILEARDLVKDLSLQEQIMEIGFILNARHGLRLAKRFGGMVSVELHTDIAHDLEAIFKYGIRYGEINPKQFIVKVPFTPTGLLGARRLHENGIRVNFTLEFSARQNLFATAIAQADYVNVFMGRLGAYCQENGLGSGKGVGERTVIASQQWVNRMNHQYGLSTKLIAASLRSADQVESLAGTDVFTMPVRVAADARARLSGKFTSHLQELYPVDLNTGTQELHIEKLWEVSEKELLLLRDMADELPCCGNCIAEQAQKAGCGDLFPNLSDEDLQMVRSDGKIPRHERWADRIRNGELAVDSLLNLAGLASFAHDQAELDQRIRSVIGAK
jgi:transaldolase